MCVWLCVRVVVCACGCVCVWLCVCVCQAECVPAGLSVPGGGLQSSPGRGGEASQGELRQ